MRRVKEVRFGGDALIVDLVDGPTITAPLAWYPRLLRATPEQLANWTVSGGGYGIHWPDLDEDLSTEGLVREAEARSGTLREEEALYRAYLKVELAKAEEDVQAGRLASHEEVEAETARWFAEEEHAVFGRPPDKSG